MSNKLFCSAGTGKFNYFKFNNNNTFINYNNFNLQFELRMIFIITADFLTPTKRPSTLLNTS